MISHEKSFRVPEEFKGRVNPAFIPESKNAGWIEAEGMTSRPVIRHAIGRVAERYTIDRAGRHAVHISEYYALKPFDLHLRLIEGQEVIGYTGQEIQISYALPVQEANKRRFSHSNILRAAEIVSLGKISAKAHSF